MENYYKFQWSNFLPQSLAKRLFFTFYQSAYGVLHVKQCDIKSKLAHVSLYRKCCLCSRRWRYRISFHKDSTSKNRWLKTSLPLLKCAVKPCDLFAEAVRIFLVWSICRRTAIKHWKFHVYIDMYWYLIWRALLVILNLLAWQCGTFLRNC